MTLKARIKGSDHEGQRSEHLTSKDCDFQVGASAQALVVMPLVYNPLTLKHEWMTLPSIQVDDLNVSMGDVEKLLAGKYWARTKYEMVSGLPQYIGYNSSPSAAESADDWQITKFQWSGDDLQDKQVLTGSWTNRAGLGWV